MKSFILIFIKLTVTKELSVDLDKDDPMVEAIEIPISMANCCFNGAGMAAGTSLTGWHFLEQPCLAFSAGNKLFGGI